jgi:hypothetical protein
MLADIEYTSAVRVVSVRPGVLPLPSQRVHIPTVWSWPMTRSSRTRRISQGRDDDIEVLARADVVIGWVPPSNRTRTRTCPRWRHCSVPNWLLRVRAPIRRWAPRARRLGITGRSIAPVPSRWDSGGKFNHAMVRQAVQLPPGQGHQRTDRVAQQPDQTHQARWFRVPQLQELPDPGSPLRRQAQLARSRLDRGPVRCGTPLKSEEFP